jgi:hypothetical protein
MTRLLYRSLLRLHPAAFRRQFAGEMLWIFDEASVSQGAFVLLLDLLVSVLRQWLLRSGAWKVALALIGGLMQVTAGSLGVSTRSHTFLHRVGEASPALPASVNDLIQVTLVSVGVVFVMVFALVLWVNGLNKGRLAHRYPVGKKGAGSSLNH